MTPFNKAATIIISVLIGIFLIGNYIKLEQLPERPDLYKFFAIVLLVPVAISQLFLFLFKRTAKPRRLQWVPNTLSGLAIFLMIGIQVWNFEPLNRDQKATIEQRRIEKAVQKWITENATTPESYIPLEFDEFTQTIFPYPPYMHRDSPQPLAYFLEVYNGEYVYAYYFIKHKHLLKDKANKQDTVVAMFQLTPNKQVLNVFTEAELASIFDLPQATYKWRNHYGNKNRNLELEVNGHSNKAYSFLRFYEEKTFKEIIPYSNGAINGPVYYLRNDFDTIALITYKDGVRNGDVIEFCSNGTQGFTGTNVNGVSTGLCTFRYCNGQKSSEGTRRNGRQVGLWKYWDEAGTLVKTKDFGNP